MACLHQFMVNVVKINFNEYEMIEQQRRQRIIRRERQRKMYHVLVTQTNNKECNAFCVAHTRTRCVSTPCK